MVAQRSFTIMILGVAAAMAFVLGMVGLYGALTYVVRLRTRELGLRIALGAQPGSIGRMITAQGRVLAGAGVVAGLLIVTASGRFVGSLLFGVGRTDPASLASSALVLLAGTAVACWLPVHRAPDSTPRSRCALTDHQACNGECLVW